MGYRTSSSPDTLSGTEVRVWSQGASFLETIWGQRGQRRRNMIKSFYQCHSQRGVVYAGLVVLLLPVFWPTLFSPLGHASPSMFSVSSYFHAEVLICVRYDWQSFQGFDLAKLWNCLSDVSGNDESSWILGVSPKVVLFWMMSLWYVRHSSILALVGIVLLFFFVWHGNAY